ncbi:peptide ABC transporter permease [Caldibacillus thermoamylovorans]|uniref:ABC transporter permease n=1 Tax=Caldibacillus thermoamylovorans TaxID=35841 RepID=UPI000D55880E|nr:ABC transporter permease [Caldibacillus thermoamylovorans]AWI10938.1 peptide ABC transporter permease [Caldibacillus thermoamylovorans]
MSRLKENKLLLLGIVLLLIVVSFCFVSLFYLPHDPNEMNTPDRFQLPNEEYFLGTDQFGRDILSRLMISSRYALFIGLVSVSLGAVVGLLIGAVAAMTKGMFQGFLMRMIDGLMAFPGMLLAMMLVVVLGKGMMNAVIAIAIFMIPVFARLSYSLVLDQKNNLYIKAARSYGVTGKRLIFKHILPMILPRLITQFSASIGNAILIESSLSFLGLGVQPPDASWGLMLSESRQFTLTYPYLAFPPGIILIITVLAFNLLGDALNDTMVKRRAAA